MRTLIMLLAALLVSPLKAQALRVTTDKATYAYGEPITVTVRLINTTDQAATFRLGSVFGCGRDFFFDGVSPWNTGRCFPAEVDWQVPPRGHMEWMMRVDPARTGLPSRGGTHTVRPLIGGDFNGRGFTLTDSAAFEAPAYRGGLLHLEYHPPDSAWVRSVQAEVRASVESERTYTFMSSPPITSARWSLRAGSVDSVVARFKGDARFLTFYAVRDLQGVAWAIVATEEAPEAQKAELRLWPSPARGTVHVRLPAPGLLTVYDLIGREHLRVEASATEATLDVSGLPAGLYVVRTGGETRPLVVRR